MSDANVFSTKLFQKFSVMISRYTKRSAALNCIHGQAQYFGSFWTTINKVSQKYQFSIFRMFDEEFSFFVLLNYIPKIFNQFFKLIKTAVDITDNVEWTMFCPAVGPERLALDF